MFKVVKPEYTNKTFRVPTELVKALGQTAHDMGVSMNNLVVQCCEYALENLASAAAEKKSDAAFCDAPAKGPTTKGD
jgi:hypothetical protein